jgi:hypothetical protein
MRYDGGNPLKYQGRLEALRMSPLNPVECDLWGSLHLFCWVSDHNAINSSLSRTIKAQEAIESGIEETTNTERPKPLLGSQ